MTAATPDSDPEMIAQSTTPQSTTVLNSRERKTCFLDIRAAGACGRGESETRGSLASAESPAFRHSRRTVQSLQISLPARYLGRLSRDSSGAHSPAHRTDSVT